MNKIIKLFEILKSTNYRNALLKYRVATSVENVPVLKKLSPYNIRTIIDVGANRGQFSLVARHHFPEAMIISFEPLKEPARIFRNVFHPDSLTTLYEIAIGSIEKETVIHVSNEDDSSSLLPISSLQDQLFPGTAEKESRIIQEKPLDAILSESDIQVPALLKIDVQGFEKQVLEGSITLLPLFSAIYVECSFVELYAGQALSHEIISFLSTYGFILSGIYNLYSDKKGHPIQADFLFTKKNNNKISA